MVHNSNFDNPFATEREVYQYSEDANIQYGEVDLDGLGIPIQGTVQVNQLGVFEPRFVIGDPKFTDDKYFSVWNQNDWTGGGQKQVLNSASDTTRFYHATLDTKHPNMLTLLPETVSYAGATADTAYPLGDYDDTGSKILFWASFGIDLSYWDTGTAAYVSTGESLTAEPVNKGVVFDDILYIPLGSSGYDTWNGTVVTNVNTITPVAFVEWDNKLVALGTDGQISVLDDPVDGWDGPSTMRLRGNRTPRNLVVWWTQDRFPAVFIVTNRDVWACDFLNEVLYRTGLRFPVHPDFGLGSCVWQDDALYVSVGIGVHQLSLGGVVSAMGLDRNSGIVDYLRGAIVDMEPEYNGVFALLKGVASVSVGADSGDVLEEGALFDDALVVPTESENARSSLMQWTGTGWHSLWESEDTSGTPSRVMVSEADGEYRVWWGYGDLMYSQLLRRTFHNPMQGADLGIDRFAPSGMMIAGRFDADMAMNVKSASHLEAHLDKSSTGTIDVSYMTDQTDPTWVSFGTFEDTGNQVIKFDPDGDGWSEGLAFRWIDFQYEFSSADALGTPIVNWITLKFLKVPLQTKSWSFLVPLAFPEQWKGRSPQEIMDHLDRLATGTRFVTFKHRNQTYRVRVAASIGPEQTGHNIEGLRQVNLIEMDRQDETAEDVDA